MVQLIINLFDGRWASPQIVDIDAGRDDEMDAADAAGQEASGPGASTRDDADAAGAGAGGERVTKNEILWSFILL